jgi:hypothetical protein
MAKKNTKAIVNHCCLTFRPTVREPREFVLVGRLSTRDLRTRFARSTLFPRFFGFYDRW